MGCKATAGFATGQSLTSQKKILLNPAPAAFINNAVQISNIAPEYAPAGQHLLACTVLGQPTLDDEAIVARCRSELAGWFGAERITPSRLRALELNPDAVRTIRPAARCP